MKCPSCRRNSATTNSDDANARRRRFFEFLITAVLVVVCVACVVFFVLYTDVVPPSDISLSTMGLTSSGLDYPNATSHPVFHLIAKFTDSSGSACLRRISTTVSYSGITLAKSVDSDKKFKCSESSDSYYYGTDDLFAMEMSGPAMNLPSSVDIHKPMFDVDIEFEGGNIVRNVYYHVSCKGLALGLVKDFPVPCDTTFSPHKG